MGGTTMHNIVALERIKRSASNFISGYPGIDYKEHLAIKSSAFPLTYGQLQYMAVDYPLFDAKLLHQTIK